MLACGQAVFAQPPVDSDRPRFTLEECIQFALQNQLAIQVQASARERSVEQKNIARSYYFPQVKYAMSYTRLDDQITNTAPTPFSGPAGDIFADAAAYFGIARQAGSAVANAALDNPSAPPFSDARAAARAALPQTAEIGVLGKTLYINQVFLTQPIWTGGKIKYKTQQAELGIRAADADVTKSQQQTVFDVTQAYLSVQLTQSLRDVVEAQSGQIRAIEQLVENLLKHGDEYVTVVDLSRPRTVRQLTQAEQIQIEQSHALAMAALNQTMGFEAGEEFGLVEEKLTDRMVKEPAILSAQQLIEAALDRRPELRQARLGVENAALERRLAKAAYMPDLGLFGQFQYLDDGPGYLTQANLPQWSVGVGLSVPLATGGRRSAQRRRSDLGELQARQTEQLAQQLIALEVQKVYLAYEEAIRRLPLAKAARDESDATLEAYRNIFIGGLVRDEDLPNYFEDLVQARLLRTQAWIGYYKTVYALCVSLAQIHLVTGADNDAIPLPVPASDVGDVSISHFGQ